MLRGTRQKHAGTFLVGMEKPWNRVKFLAVIFITLRSIGFSSLMLKSAARIRLRLSYNFDGTLH